MGDGDLGAATACTQLMEIMGRDDGLETRARAALSLGCEVLGVKHAHVARVDTATDHWEVVASTDPADGWFPPGLESDLGERFCRHTIQEPPSLSITDAAAEGYADDPAFATHEVAAYHGTVLRLDDELYGTVCFVDPDPRETPFTDAQTVFSNLLARSLEREIEREYHTASLRRQTDLATVLNRVLRHNLRNDLTVIRGHTQRLTDQVDHDESSGDIALRYIDDLIELAEKARTLERIIAGEFDREPTDLSAMVERITDALADDHPAASITVEGEVGVRVPVLGSFEQALWELLENAVKHAGPEPTVVVTIETVPNGVAIRITDDGPGLSAQERSVLETGAETPLVHGSGLGLWLAHWVVSSHDGTIEPEVTGEGTTMTITVPRNPEAPVQDQITNLSRARDQYRAAFEEANDGMVFVDDQARIVAANQAAARIYGVDEAALQGRNLQEFIPPDFPFEEEWQRFEAGGIDRDTLTISGADGVERPVEYSAARNVVPGQHLIVVRERNPERVSS